MSKQDPSGNISKENQVNDQVHKQVNGGAMRMPQYSPYMHQASTSSYGQGPQAQAPQYFMAGQMQQTAGMRPQPMTTMSMSGSGYVQRQTAAAPRPYYVPTVAPQAQQQPPPRERKVILILDHQTGRDVLADNGTVKGSVEAGGVRSHAPTTAAGAASAVASSASASDQSTVKPQQQPEPTGCEPVNYKASNEPAASTKDTTGKSTVLHRGTATSSPAARPPKRMQTVPKYRYWEAAAGQLAGQDSPEDEIAQLATFTDTLLVCCLCGRLLKDTVQLTCLHNCCQCCFSAAASACNSRYVACCLCGDLTILGAQQPNGFIERELQRYMAIADSRSCGACKDNGEPDTPATVWCSACKHSLCGDCLALHKRYKRSHVTQSLDELKSLDEVCVQSPSSSCPIHKRPLEIACLNCKRPKCTSCWIECKKNMHEMHISGDDSFENYVNQFIAYISSDESVLLQMAQVLDNPKSLLIDLKAARALHLEQISRRKRRIADAVDVAYQKVECLTKDAYDDLEKEAGDASKVAERIGLNLSDARKYIRRLFEANNKHEILNQHEIIRERQKVLSADLRDLKNTTDAIRAVDIESSLPDDLESVFEAWIGVLHTDSDQWSPINPEGKKLYDREFLLAPQYAKQSFERPEGLPQLSDIILNKGPRGSSSKNDRVRGGGGGRSPPRDVGPPRKVVEIKREGRTGEPMSNVLQESARNSEPPRSTERQRDNDKPKQLLDHDIEKKATNIHEEFLHNVDVKEALQSIEELQQPDNIDVLVRSMIMGVLERSQQARKHTAQLLSEAIKGGLISTENYLKGLSGVTEVADDLAVDVPHIWTYLSELIAPMLQADSLKMSTLLPICQPLLEVDRAGELMAKVLRESTRNLGPEKVADLWSASGLQWSAFLSSGHDVKSFLTQHKLEFLLGECEPNAHAPVCRKNTTDMASSLDEILIRSNGSNQDVFSWHEKNVREDPTKQRAFIRALVECVARQAIEQSGGGCTLLQKDLQGRAPLLVRFIDKNTELELQALFALQSLLHRLQHPANILRSIFDWLYDEDIISEDTFYQWLKNDDPSEREGKGVALESTKQFFTWLQNADPADP